MPSEAFWLQEPSYSKFCLSAPQFAEAEASARQEGGGDYTLGLHALEVFSLSMLV